MPIADALGDVLRERQLEAELARTRVLEAWGRIVGAQIAAATQPRLVTDDGTMVIGVKTHGWMQELSLMERQLIAKLREASPESGVKRLRYELLRA